jgi:hypothetical protein
MAADDLKTEYHLTPDGWVTGTSKFFGNIDAAGEIPRAENAVETWEKHIYQRSQWSSEEVTSAMIWHDPSVPELERDALRATFGPCGG